MAPANLPADARAALLLPAGGKGPALLVFRNYDAIYSYNAAESYALAIATLADQLRGGTGLATAWPTDDPGIGRDERRQLQTLLLARGHDIGSADGMIGTATRRAIQVEQQRLGWANADGRAGQRILRTLQNAPRTAPVPTRFMLPSNYSAVQSPAIRSRSHVQQIQGVRSGQYQGLDAWLVETGDASAAISVLPAAFLVPKGQPDLMWLSPARRTAHADPRRQPRLLAVPPRPGQRRARPRFRPYRAVGTATGPSPGRRQHRAHAGTPGAAEPGPAIEDDCARRPPVDPATDHRERRQFPASITQALHNYFRVGDASAVDVDGVDGLDHLDKFENCDAASAAGRLDVARSP